MVNSRNNIHGTQKPTNVQFLITHSTIKHVQTGRIYMFGLNKQYKNSDSKPACPGFVFWLIMQLINLPMGVCCTGFSNIILILAYSEVNLISLLLTIIQILLWILALTFNIFSYYNYRKDNTAQHTKYKNKTRALGLSAFQVQVASYIVNIIIAII